MLTGLERPILEPGRTCWVVSPARASGLLIDGRSYYRAFHAAASAATRYILVAGWQFDSDVPLLRDRDRTPESGEARFLEFLASLCRARPGLLVVLLCWDYSPAYMLDREWFQELLFRWKSGNRVRFRFDDRHAFGASHHQKFAVIDGALAFVGSMDLCHDRWDDRTHAAVSASRLEPSGDDSYGPYHEVQAYVRGPAVAELRELFEARWKAAGGEDLRLPAPAADVDVPLRPDVRMAAAEVGLSRTVARTRIPEHPPVREIEALYRAAIDAAESLIYMENQYFGSRAVFEALVRRMRERERPKLQIVMLFPRDLVSFTEAMSMRASQNAMFRLLKDVAVRTGHDLGLYYARSLGPGGVEKPRYIHSKLLLVDDRFLTLGSANANNRSMGLDTELNVSWEAMPEGEPALQRSIRRVRVSLLGEHAGLGPRASLERLGRAEGLVETLEALAEAPGGTLRRREVPYHPADSAWRAAFGAEGLSMDPGPLLDAEAFESVAPPRKALLRTGFRRLSRVIGRRRRLRRRIAVDPPSALAKPPDLLRVTLSQTLWKASLLLAGVLVVLLLGWGISLLLRILAGE